MEHEDIEQGIATKFLAALVYIGMTVIAAALFSGAAMAQNNTFGVHVGTYHSPNIDCSNGKNPGGYVRLEVGIVLGTYYNSCERQSAYIGYLTPSWRGLGVMFAGVTGYAESVTPLAFPTYSFRVYEDLRLRVSGASWDGRTVVHLSAERNF